MFVKEIKRNNQNIAFPLELPFLSALRAYIILVKSSNRPRVFYRFSEKLLAQDQFRLHYRIDLPISKRYQKTAKQNSLNCIREALPNTRTLNFKIHKNLHWMVG